ncbi:MAG: hypothetical protein EP335_12530 [Alphaproteobacteria bacterium]|nr:MAG: hypothetical protein EP335_12530 [Alphaproteobacteria bacterium]
MSTARLEFERMRVLIALSNPQLAEFILHYLKDNRVGAVQLAQSTPVALNRLKDGRFTHFFLDYEFGDRGGADFARFMRVMDGPMAEAPIMMIIPNPDRAKVFSARDSGVNEILGLPLTAKLLQTRLAHMTNNPKPFIRAPGYIGPCRRRDPAQIYHGDERRGSGSRKVLASNMA